MTSSASRTNHSKKNWNNSSQFSSDSVSTPTPYDRTKAAWTQASCWITQSRNPFATRNTYGVRQLSEHELFRLGKISNYLKNMGIQSMPVLSPMASIPSNKDTRKDNARTVTISNGVQSHVTRETMLTQLNNREMILVMTDTNPYMIGSGIITKSKACGCLQSQPNWSTLSYCN